MSADTSTWQPAKKTALLLTANGEAFYGYGLGATGHTIGEVCFNTAMTGYQEILTDPSYNQQIVTFTFPHIGNVGTNDEDGETSNPDVARAANGLIIREAITQPSNYRNTMHLNDWLIAKGLIGISGLDTRTLTAHIRDHGMFNAILAHDPNGVFDNPALQAELDGFSGLEGADLAAEVTSKTAYAWNQTRWAWNQGFSENDPKVEDMPHVVALDYGVKKNILLLGASWLPRLGGKRIGLSARDFGAKPRWHLFVQWPRRPGRNG